MKLTNEATLKIFNDIQLMEECDTKFTQALQALEEKEYGLAYIIAKEVENKSKCIEQRCAAMMVKTIAAEYNDEKAQQFLDKIYDL